jgi:hypothetical protein
MKKTKCMTCCIKSCSNRVIELNLKMLTLKRFVMNNYYFHIKIKILMLQRYFIKNSVVIITYTIIFCYASFKINIFWFSSITQLKPNPTQRFWYIIFSIYCFRVGHLYTCQQSGDTQMSQRFYWKQGPHRLPWTMM